MRILAAGITQPTYSYLKGTETMRLSASLVCALVLLSGCADQVVEPSTAAPYPAPPPTTELDGVRGSLLVGDWANRHQEVVVWMQTSGRPLGAYQARLRFERPMLSYDGARAPDGGFRVLNDDASDSGVVRFAGFKVDGFDDREVLRVDFSAEQPIDPSQLSLELEAIGTLEGEAVAQNQMSVELNLFALPQ